MSLTASDATSERRQAFGVLLRALRVAVVAGCCGLTVAGSGGSVRAEVGRGSGVVRDVPGTYATIQAAIDAATSGDTVLVQPGTYAERIRYAGKEIAVVSAGGPEVTTIDGGGGGPVVRFLQGAGTGASLEGFTITGGLGKLRGARRFGGGIVGLEASPLVRDNILENNEAHAGAGAAFAGGAPVFEDNIVRENIARSDGVLRIQGAGLAFFGGSPTLTRNRIESNGLVGIAPQEIGPGEGGGIFAKNVTGALFTDNEIVGNYFQNTLGVAGGGLWLSGGDSMITGGEVRGNTTCDYGGGIALVDHVMHIESCRITANFTCDDGAPGGGVAVLGTSVVDIVNVRLDANETYFGGGLYCEGAASVMMIGCAVTNNFACFGAGVYGDAMIANGSILRNRLCDLEGADGSGVFGDGAIANSIVRENQTFSGAEHRTLAGTIVVRSSNVTGGVPGPDNLDVPVAFAVSLDGLPQLRFDTDGALELATEPVPGLPDVDLDGDDRILDADGDNVALLDLGADEMRREVAVRFGNQTAAAGIELPDTVNALSLNGSIGDRARVVRVAEGEAIRLDIGVDGEDGARFVVHGNAGMPTVDSLRTLPVDIGTIGFPLLAPEALPSVVWNNIGRPADLGSTIYFGQPGPDPGPTPELLLDLPNGDAVNLPAGTTLTFQGLVQSATTTNPRRVSVTNAVVLVVE